MKQQNTDEQYDVDFEDDDSEDTYDDSYDLEGFSHQKSPYKGIIIIVLILIMIGSGGYFIYGKFVKNKPQQVNDEDKKVQAEISVEPKNQESEDSDTSSEEIPGLITEDNIEEDSYLKPEQKKDKKVAKVKIPGSSKEDNKEPNSSSDIKEEIASNNQYSSSRNAGAPDLMENKNNTMDTRPSAKKEYVSDINGNLVPSNFEGKNTRYVRDYVSYKKERHLLDKGMEELKLQVTWKKLKYSQQVPFTVFKELDAEGIVPVELEVTVTTEGSTIITYMRVITDEVDKEKRKGD